MKNYKYLYYKYKTKYFLLIGGSKFIEKIKSLEEINILLGVSIRNPNDYLRFKDNKFFNIYIDNNYLPVWDDIMLSLKPLSYNSFILKNIKPTAKINIYFDKFVIDFILLNVFIHDYYLLTNCNINIIMFELRKNKVPRASIIKNINDKGEIELNRNRHIDPVDDIFDDYYYIENDIIKWRRTENLEKIIKKSVIAPPNIVISSLVDSKYINLESDDKQYFHIYATIITESTGFLKDFNFVIYDYTYKNYTYPFEIRLKLVKSSNTEPEIDPNDKFIEIYEDIDLIFNEIMTREERCKYIDEKNITDEFMIILEERLSKNKEILEKISIDKMRYLFNKPQYYIVFTRKIKD